MPLLAAWIDAEAIRPDVVLCSTAVRTKQTLAGVLEALGDPDVAYEDGLYHVGAEALLERVRALPGETGEAMLVGHNPGLQELALLLAEPGPQRDRLAGKLPTGALVTLVAEGEWSELEAASITAFVTPKELAAR